jgi:hypothetical protein
MVLVPSSVRAVVLGAPRWADLLPWRRFTIRTTVTVDDAVAEFGRSVGRARVLGGGAGDGSSPFAGQAAGNRFVFSRQIAYRNSFLPIIEAVVTPDGRGARIEIQMRLHPFVLAFMTVWMAGATLGGLLGLVAAIFHGSPEGLLALLLPVFGGGMVAAAFTYEARRAEAMLRAMFPPAAELPDGLPPYR